MNLWISAAFVSWLDAPERFANVYLQKLHTPNSLHIQAKILYVYEKKSRFQTLVCLFFVRYQISIIL